MKAFLKRFAACAAVCLFTGAAAEARSFRTVVIDPGHGGHDKGAQWGRVYEKHLCMDTSARLEAYLKEMGFNTVMTRNSDYFVSLPQRVAIANRYRDAVFVAVHYNFTWNESASGLETFYCNPDSQNFAGMVQSSVMNRVRAVNRGPKFARYYVIRNNQCPAILVECGFVSNPGERGRMKSAWYRDALAKGIAEGIMRFRKDG
jgi:N-acetylmuramoyl-L-alanine amidase